MMEPNHFDVKKLEQSLANNRELEAPPWLVGRIMAEIGDRPPSFFAWLHQWWLRPQSVSFSPARLGLTVAVTLCAFWLGTLSERHGKPDSTGGSKSAMPALADNAEANYLIGRGLLAAGQDDQAIVFLRQAVRQEPGVAEFAHWQGVAYQAKGALVEERQSYLALPEQPEYLPSLLNLGHNYLESGDYRQALAQYEKVLQQDPLEASALYNRALIYHMMEDTERAEQAFLSYLEHNRTGKWVFRAIRHLHELGNYSFRSYRIGTGQVVLSMSALLSQDAQACRPELQRLAEALVRTPDSELHLVIYDQGNRDAAKTTATALQKQLTNYLGDEHATPVRGSWFDVAETFTDATGSERQLASGLLIFTRTTEQFKKRNST
jgi:tetratricopeptide (TPR) repeat protein